jgi:putative restriction endonuclease
VAKRVPWSSDQLLVAFRLYCRTPFGRLHRGNREIIELSRKIGRTPSALAMKACNFASLDPEQRKRKITALANASRADRDLWKRFEQNPEEVVSEAEEAYARIAGRDVIAAEVEFEAPEGPSEVARVIRARRLQGFFRDAVLVSYENRCALSGIALADLLNASHIIPWSKDIHRRADPRNGIALNVLYDRAFDRGLITFDSSLRVVVSRRLRKEPIAPLQLQALLQLEGRTLRSPVRFAPDPEALEYHREHVFHD